LYVAAESGVVALFGTGTDRVLKIRQASLGPDAHVVAVDLASHHSYFPLKNVAGRPVLRIMQPLASLTTRTD
jgi:hypothetical protein